MPFLSGITGNQGIRDCSSQPPEYFNFVDTIDDWACKEQEGKRQTQPPALWWIDGHGKEVKWSFQDVALISKRAANVLSEVCGIGQGDRVMVIVPRIPEYWLLLAACLRTGSIFIPTPMEVSPKELKWRIMAVKPKCIVATTGVVDYLLNAIDQVLAIEKDCSIKFTLLTCRMAEDVREGWLMFDKLLEEQSYEHQSVRSLGTGPICIFFTSGTTGNSKMVEHTQASLGLASSISSVVFGFKPDDLVWCCSSTGWIMLLLHTFFCSWCVGAGVFVHYERLSPKATLHNLQDYPISSVFLFPTTLVGVLHEDLESFHFPKLSHCVTGGEPFKNPKVLIEWRERTGLDVKEVYGQTEMGHISITPRDSEARPGSMGKPLPGLDLMIIDDNENEVPPGIVGDIVLRVNVSRPMTMFSRYVDNPEKTKSVRHGDFYLTGDRGRKDGDSYLWFSERVDDVIFFDGNNINPHEIENSLNQHPAVRESSVVSSPHPTLGQVVKAFAVLKSGFIIKDEIELIKELQDHVSTDSGSWLSPRKVEFIQSLPRTLTGKVNRAALRRKEWQQK